MHIHGHQMNFNALNPYAAASESQRKADVRKKLMKSASDIEGISSAEEAGSLSRMMNGSRGRLFGDDEYHAGSSSRNSDFS